MAWKRVYDVFYLRIYWHGISCQKIHLPLGDPEMFNEICTNFDRFTTSLPSKEWKILCLPAHFFKSIDQIICCRQIKGHNKEGRLKKYLLCELRRLLTVELRLEGNRKNRTRSWQQKTYSYCERSIGEKLFMST